MKEVVVTGASSGIGAAIAKEFSENGWKVHLMARSLEKLKNVQASLQNPSHIYSVDLSQPASIQKAVSDLKKNQASISVVVNNAGIYRPTSFAQETNENWHWHFATNLFGAVEITRLLWSDLVSHKGCVTNVSSTLSLRPIPNTGAYAASKAAMDNWTQTLALEGGPLGVRANSICPGLVDTPIHGFHKSDQAPHRELKETLKKLQPLGRMGQPEDIARAVYFVSSEKASWMTGALIPVDGGVTTTTNDPF